MKAAPYKNSALKNVLSMARTVVVIGVAVAVVAA